MSLRLQRPLNILAVPNEDGFGPSALLSYVVKEMLAQRPDCHVTIWNRSRAEYNRNLYRDLIAAGRVTVEPVNNLIELAKVKATGKISIPKTLKSIGDYAAKSRRYAAKVSADRFDLVVEFGVPAVARWAGERGIPCVGIFDHSWSLTLEQIFNDAKATRQRTKWQQLVEAVRQDEAFTKRLFLFPEFLSPTKFQKQWQKIAPNAEVRRFVGVLGRGSSWTEKQTREYLRISEPGRLVLIQAGDTGIWDALLPRLAKSLVKQRDELSARQLNVALYVPRRLEKWATYIKAHKCSRICTFKPMPGGTTQQVLPFVDLLVTRAGGGTVNDAVACRTPFVCVHEHGHSQVEATLAACVRRGLTRVVDNAALAADPLRVIAAELDRVRDNRKLVAAMRKISNHAEKKLAREILRLGSLSFERCVNGRRDRSRTADSGRGRRGGGCESRGTPKRGCSSAAG